MKIADIETSISNFWYLYSGHVLVSVIVAIIAYCQYPSIHTWLYCGLKYGGSYNAVDQQIEFLEIQDAIKHGGRDELSGADLTLSEAGSAQKDARDFVMDQLRHPVRDDSQDLFWYVGPIED